MHEIMQAQVRILLLMQEQNRLSIELLSARSLNHRSHAGMELSKHCRDEHQRYWNSDAAVDHQAEYQDEERALATKWDELTAQINNAIKELEEMLSSVTA